MSVWVGRKCPPVERFPLASVLLVRRYLFFFFFLCHQRVVPCVQTKMNCCGCEWCRKDRVFRGQRRFFPERASDRRHPKKGGGGKLEKAARGSSEEAKTWVVGPWAKWSRVAFCRGRAGPKQNRQRQDIETYPTLYFFFCIGNGQKSGGGGNGVVMKKTLVVCFGQDVCGEV